MMNCNLSNIIENGTYCDVHKRNVRECLADLYEKNDFLEAELVYLRGVIEKAAIGKSVNRVDYFIGKVIESGDRGSRVYEVAMNAIRTSNSISKELNKNP